MGNGSLFFNNDGGNNIRNNYIITPSNSHLTMTGNFTIEFWFKCGTQLDGYPQIMSHIGPFQSTFYQIGISFSDQGPGKLVLAGPGGRYYVSNRRLDDNVWHNVAFVQSTNDGKLRVFIDGVLDRTLNILLSTWDYSGGLTIGANYLDYPNGSYNGYVSNIRFVNGTALYKRNYTVIYAPYSAIPNTVLLLNTSVGSPFKDNSSLNLQMIVSSPAPTVSQNSFIITPHLSNPSSRLPTNSLSTNDEEDLLFNGIVLPVQNMLVSNTSNTISIGTNKSTNGQNQSANSIVLNASGTSLPASNAGFYVTPLNNVTQTSILGYNKTTKEVTYWDISNAYGKTGSTGPTGERGFTGSTGWTGCTGPVGTQGAQGPQGYQGTQGAQGANGAQGAQGNQGNQGAQGAQGAQGTAGSRGPQGVAGTSSKLASQTTSAITITPPVTSDQTLYVDTNLSYIKGNSLIVSDLSFNNSFQGTVSSYQNLISDPTLRPEYLANPSNGNSILVWNNTNVNVSNWYADPSHNYVLTFYRGWQLSTLNGLTCVETNSGTIANGMILNPLNDGPNSIIPCTNGISLSMVYRRKTGGGGNFGVGIYFGVNNNINITSDYGDSFSRFNIGSNNVNTSSNIIADTNAHILTLVINPNQSNGGKIYLDGVNIGTCSSVGYTFTTTLFQLNHNFVIIDYGEFILLNYAMNDSDRRLTESYLANKWNVSISNPIPTTQSGAIGQLTVGNVQSVSGFNSAVSSVFNVNVNGLNGTSGAQGAQGTAGTPGGPQGAQGASGSDGAQGAAGSAGAQGASGTNGIIASGIATFSNSSVSITPGVSGLNSSTTVVMMTSVNGTTISPHYYYNVTSGTTITLGNQTNSDNGKVAWAILKI
jgi:hypothetical protein